MYDIFADTSGWGKLGIFESLATDHHFEQAGFTLLLKQNL
jgi:hypothetical protein